MSFSRRGRDRLAEASAAIFVAVSENTGDEFTGDGAVAVVNGETEKPKFFLQLSSCIVVLTFREVPGRAW